MSYTVFVAVKYSKDWLALPREERNAFNERVLGPIFACYDGRVSMRFFDTEAFSVDASDFILFSCADLKDYYFLMEELRDTALFTKEWLTLVRVYIGIEDGFKEFERAGAKA